VKTLREAVTLHVRELLLVREEAWEVKKTLRDLDRAGKRAPRKMRPGKGRATGIRRLREAEVQSMLEFLKALSPRG